MQSGRIVLDNLRLNLCLLNIRASFTVMILPCTCLPAATSYNFDSIRGFFSPGSTRHRGGFVMGDAADTTNTIALTAEIVAAYVSNNTVAAADIPALINQVHTGLLRVTTGEAQHPPEPLKPAVPIKRSINPDFIVCLDDGKKFKSLKRHLRTQYNMTPEQYREKWSLPGDYPMVAPNYAAARSQLAKQMGLGQQRPRRR